jgi:hypothetical protein
VTPEELAELQALLEDLAIQHRADYGIVPTALWFSLSDSGRCRVGTLSQAKALTITSRTITPTIDEVALADLLDRCRA